MAAPTSVLNRENASNEFRQKSAAIQQLINEALHILVSLGIPLGQPPHHTPRRLERMALAFLAVADVRAPGGWSQAKDLGDGRSLKSRDIIAYVNEHLEENQSRGSYDDVRRMDLRLPVAAQLVVQAHPGSARNNPTRGYALNPRFAAIIRRYGESDWDQEVATILADEATLSDRLSGTRQLQRVPIRLPDGQMLDFGPGAHNQLLRAVIEDLLPNYGHGAEILYVGDAENRRLLVVEDRLRELQFFELAHGELPDVVAYSPERNWLYLIEAVHSSGPIGRLRRETLAALTAACPARVIFVTAFPNMQTFRRFVDQIAWETDVWIADHPKHLIHFDGDRFLEPYNPL